MIVVPADCAVVRLSDTAWNSGGSMGVNAAEVIYEPFSDERTYDASCKPDQISHGTSRDWEDVSS